MRCTAAARQEQTSFARERSVSFAGPTSGQTKLRSLRRLESLSCSASLSLMMELLLWSARYSNNPTAASVARRQDVNTSSRARPTLGWCLPRPVVEGGDFLHRTRGEYRAPAVFNVRNLHLRIANPH